MRRDRIYRGRSRAVRSRDRPGDGDGWSGRHRRDRGSVHPADAAEGHRGAGGQVRPVAGEGTAEPRKDCADRPLGQGSRAGVIPITDAAVSVYTIPTDGPESDGTLEWTSTTIVVVEIAAG